MCFCVMSDSSEGAYFSHQPNGTGGSRGEKKTEERASVKYFEMFIFKAPLFSFIFLHFAITFAKECWSHGKIHQSLYEIAQCSSNE